MTAAVLILAALVVAGMVWWFGRRELRRLLLGEDGD